MHKPSRSRQRLQQYGIPNPIGIRYSEGCAVVVVEGAAVRPMSRGTTTMIIIGIVLRVRFKTSSGVIELSQHEADGGQFQEREGVAVEIFPVLGETAATVEPRNRAFDDPTLG